MTSVFFNKTDDTYDYASNYGHNSGTNHTWRICTLQLLYWDQRIPFRTNLANQTINEKGTHTYINIYIFTKLTKSIQNIPLVRKIVQFQP